MPASTTYAEEMGLGPKKTALVLFTVIGCIAILFPKIFYPMIIGPAFKEDRMPSNLMKQERPNVIRDVLHPGMKERGRAITPHTVPIVERQLPPHLNNPKIIERRAGNPNMRVAFQAQQQQQKTQGASSVIMPLYTGIIVAFFIFTIVKIVKKKFNKNINQPLESDTQFVEKVFKQTESDPKKKIGWKKDHNAIYTAIQGIIDATNEQLKEIEEKCAENNIEHFNETDTKTNVPDPETPEKDQVEDKTSIEEEIKNTTATFDDSMKINEKEKEDNADLEFSKRLTNLRESMHIKAVENIENSDLKSIFLEGELPHDPQILVSATETETKTEKVSNFEKDLDDETVILSGKMTISLISLTNNEEEKKNGATDDYSTTNVA